MSKLDGNGRWSTKMVTTEHHQLYDNRENKGFLQTKATAEEMTLIRDAMMLPLAMDVVHHAHERVMLERATLYQPIGRFLLKLMERIADATFNVRKELKRRNIKVIGETLQDDITTYEFVCRGFEDRLSIARESMRAEIGQHIRRITESLL